MSMKKKFLALALAGMVAMPVVANATNNVNTVMGNEGTPLDTSVGIEGTVATDNGQAPAGKIQVELPTAMVFTVDKNGAFDTASNYSVTNQGSKAISVNITGFTEQQQNGGITIDSYDTIKASQGTTSRSTVGLKVKGDTTAVNLTVGMTGENALFTDIQPGAKEPMVLEGIAGTKPASASAGASENFTLQFRIKAK